MKVTLKSGAILDITKTFETSHKLFKTVLKELKGVNLKLGLKEGSATSNIFDLQITDDTLNTAKDGIFTILSSQEIEDTLWSCFNGRVLYNSKKVLGPDFFNDEKICEDYHEVMKEVMTANLSPFQKSLASLFPAFRPRVKKPEDQRSK